MLATNNSSAPPKFVTVAEVRRLAAPLDSIAKAVEALRERLASSEQQLDLHGVEEGPAEAIAVVVVGSIPIAVRHPNPNKGENENQGQMRKRIVWEECIHRTRVCYKLYCYRQKKIIKFEKIYIKK